MMIQRVGALTGNANVSNNATAQKQQAPSFEGLGVNKAGKTMKALAAAAILGMASVGMSSCVQPNDPTPYEIPEEKPTEETPVEETPTEETPVVDEGETKPTEETPTTPVEEEPTTPTEETPSTSEDEGASKPVVEEPTTPTEETPSTPAEEETTTPVVDEGETKPVVDEGETTPTEEGTEITEDNGVKGTEKTSYVPDVSITPAIAASNEYKFFREIGYEHITGVDVPVEEGKYQPKSGEIVEYFSKDGGCDVGRYTLNRDKSTDGRLVYDVYTYDEDYGEENSAEFYTDHELSFDFDKKMFIRYHAASDGDHEGGEYWYTRIKEDGKLADGGFAMDRDSTDPTKNVPHNFGIEKEMWFDNTQSAWYDESIKYEDALFSDPDGWCDVIIPEETNIAIKLAK